MFDAFHLPDGRTVVAHNMVTCRSCGVTIDAATPMTGKATVETGDMSVCFRCGELAVFEVGPFGVVLREPSLDELATFCRAYPGVTAAIQQFWIERGRPL